MVKKSVLSLYVIAYDIQIDKNRTRLAEILSSHGLRINLSVFECLLRPAHLSKLVDQIKTCLDPETDQCIIYPICTGCEQRALYLKPPVQNKSKLVK